VIISTVVAVLSRVLRAANFWCSEHYGETCITPTLTVSIRITPHLQFEQVPSNPTSISSPSDNLRQRISHCLQQQHCINFTGRLLWKNMSLGNEIRMQSVKMRRSREILLEVWYSVICANGKTLTTDTQQSFLHGRPMPNWTKHRPMGAEY
jgi:hypothetical protein